MTELTFLKVYTLIKLTVYVGLRELKICHCNNGF